MCDCTVCCVPESKNRIKHGWMRCELLCIIPENVKYHTEYSLDSPLPSARCVYVNIALTLLRI